MRESYYSLLASGSTATSADTAHILTGNYSGLSTLHNDSVVYLWLRARTNDAILFPTLVSSSVRTGIPVSTSLAEMTQLPPQRVGSASQYHIVNNTAGKNSDVDWIFWERVP